MQEILQKLNIKPQNSSFSTGLEWGMLNGEHFHPIHSPVDGSLIASVQYSNESNYNFVVEKAENAYIEWRKVPAPKRGEIIRQIGNALRNNKEELGKLVSYEMGKALQEGLGEVQEMIDICDFAVGLSRQLHGLTMHSERPNHRMYEQWHPIGIVGIISAFNFPVAVWAWNAMLATICGNVCIWKPSEKAPLSAIACQNIIQEVLKQNNLPEGIFNLVLGDVKTGKLLSEDERVALVSATGSVRMGKEVAKSVSGRLGKVLLELGGNNAIIITPDADMEMALRAITFGAVGTCGQRCTSTRRLIIHESVYENLKNKLLKIYSTLTIGNPLNEKNLVGPLIDKIAVSSFINAIENAKSEGCNLLIGGEVLKGEGYETGTYVKPALIEAENHFKIVQEETFAPILYLLKYSGPIENAIFIQNNVRQGLSSSIFSNNIRETEKFLSFAGSDCGIANVNIGTSGAEIGGAFGGEKETGGGRESGSDAWKAYMRRQTNTINFGTDLPLAQGIEFNI